LLTSWDIQEQLWKTEQKAVLFLVSLFGRSRYLPDIEKFCHWVGLESFFLVDKAQIFAHLEHTGTNCHLLEFLFKQFSSWEM